jgi:SAM-dependent methyltransferase
MDHAPTTAYDEVFYPGHPFDETHPDHLATLATLYGMKPAPVPCCRVLELGCGVGGNLVPMAYQWPDSTFVGIDLSGASIAEGSRTVAAIGLKNVRLRQLDIMDVGAEFGKFDYIIAHGVYSWVPEVVREKILSIFKTNLAPQGVAYVSYNAYPGSYQREIARAAMLYRAGQTANPAEKVRQSRAVMQFLVEATPEDELYGLILRGQNARVKQMTDELLYHDDLNEISTPSWLYEVAESAADHGLQYLCDATFSRSHLHNYSQKVVEQLGRIPEAEVVMREQYLDFVEGHGFRKTLLCHDDVDLCRRIEPRCVEGYYLAGSPRPVSLDTDPLAVGETLFKTATGHALATDHRLGKAALMCLGERWPQALRFADLLQQALGRLGPEADQVMRNFDEESEALAAGLFRAFAAGHVQLHLHPPPLTTAIGERPRASLLARHEAVTASFLTSLRHIAVVIEDPEIRALLPLLDGSRTLTEIVPDLNDALSRASPGSGDDRAEPRSDSPRVTSETVENHLKALAVLGFLMA